MIPDIRNEWWLAKRIYGTKLCTLFCGSTTVIERRGRMRRAIIDRYLSDVTVARNTTFRTAFERLYGVALQTERPNSATKEAIP